MFYTVYRTTNKINGKFYVGKHQTNALNDDYLGSGKLIKRAIKKYGIENFTKEILFTFDNEQEMNDKEKELVNICEQSYNLCEGGKGGFGYINNKHLNLYDKTIRIKTGQKAKKLKMGIHSNENIGKFGLRFGQGQTRGIGFKGKIHSTETKRRIGLANSKSIGIKNSQYGTCWITKDNVNKKCNKEYLEMFLEQGWIKGRIS